MSKSQLNKLKFGIKNGTEVTLNLSSNVVVDSSDKVYFLHRLLLTETQVSSFKFISFIIKLSKAPLHEIWQSGGFIDRILGPLLKTGLPLMKNVLKPLANSVLIPLGLTVAASGTDVSVEMKMFGSGMTTLKISNEEMDVSWK